MTTDQLNIAIDKFKRTIAGGYETVTKEPDFEIHSDGMKLKYSSNSRIYTCWVNSGEDFKENPIKDFNMEYDYNSMPFAPEDND